MAKGHWKLDYEDRQKALTLFALGASVAYTQRKLNSDPQRIGREVTHEAIRKLKIRFQQDNLIEERLKEIKSHIPLVDKYVRILDLQDMIDDINEKLKASKDTPYPELLKIKKNILRQIAEEMGDIKKGGFKFEQTINTGDKPEYPSLEEKKRIVQIFSREIQEEQD